MTGTALAMTGTALAMTGTALGMTGAALAMTGGAFRNDNQHLHSIGRYDSYISIRTDCGSDRGSGRL